MKKGRKILIASSEVVPFVKTGGLADVAGALPGALEKLGAEVSVVMPLYGSIDQKKYKMKKACSSFSIPIGGEEVEVNVKMGVVPGTKANIYFIDCEKYFGRQGIYQENGMDYPDNNLRFALFSRASLEMLKNLKYKPDVIHCNDWQTGLLPVYLKVLYSGDDYYRGISTVMTIHNIAYQGNFDSNTMEQIGLPWEIYNSEGVEYWGKISYLKSGLVYADVINTVSETYAREIQDSGEYGMGMEGLLSYRSSDLYGIVNGIDYDIWNPSKDKAIASQYDDKDIRGKSRCKKSLQKELNLNSDSNPLIGMISRIDSQKGFDLLAQCIEEMIKMDAQIVMLGTGDPSYEQMLGELSQKYSENLSVILKFDEPLAHRIYSGCDMFLMPSRYEPCGLSQMIALKYGTLPIVHKTGGLADTVVDYTEDPDRGNGFTFESYNPNALMEAFERAVETYSNKRKWNTIVKRAMLMDYSWKNSASIYVELYEKSMERNLAKV